MKRVAMAGTAEQCRSGAKAGGKAGGRAGGRAD
jgi:hypothetical protein